MAQRRRRATLCLGIALAGASCRSGATAPAQPADPEDVRVAPVIAPVERSGLELAWWITHDPDGALGPTLLGLAATDQRFDADTLERLRAHGLRPVRLAESALLDLTVAAPPILGIDRLWLGLASDWTPGRLPAPLDPSAPRSIEGIGRPVPPGALRLLWRSYLAAEGLDPVLRIDLLGQAISPDHARARFDASRAALPRAIDAGPALDAVRATIVMRPGEVVVLVGEAPDADWNAPAAAPRAYDPDAPPPGVAVPAPEPAPDPVLFDADDPPPITTTPEPVETPPVPPKPRPVLRTFGQTLLTPPIPGDASRPGRMIVVVIPRIPERIEIIGRPRAAE
jgi:hypothetical protein